MTEYNYNESEWWQRLYNSVCALLYDMHIARELDVFDTLRDTYHTYFKHSDRVEATRLLAYKMLNLVVSEPSLSRMTPPIMPPLCIRTNAFINSLLLDVCY